MSEHFGGFDYFVFIAMLFISTAIGFFYAWKERNNTSEDEFLRGYLKKKVFNYFPSTVFKKSFQLFTFHCIYKIDIFD
jgi:hypothetical protein